MATANQLQNMSAPLLDRLEIIQLSGYTLDEKCHIAQVLQATAYVHKFSIHTARIPVPYKLSSSKPIKVDMSCLMMYANRTRAVFVRLLCKILSLDAEPNI